MLDNVMVFQMALKESSAQFQQEQEMREMQSVQGDIINTSQVEDTSDNGQSHTSRGNKDTKSSKTKTSKKQGASQAPCSSLIYETVEPQRLVQRSASIDYDLEIQDPTGNDTDEGVEDLESQKPIQTSTIPDYDLETQDPTAEEQSVNSGEKDLGLQLSVEEAEISHLSNSYSRNTCGNSTVLGDHDLEVTAVFRAKPRVLADSQVTEKECTRSNSSKASRRVSEEEAMGVVNDMEASHMSRYAPV